MEKIAMFLSNASTSIDIENLQKISGVLIPIAVGVILYIVASLLKESLFRVSLSETEEARLADARQKQDAAAEAQKRAENAIQDAVSDAKNAFESGPATAYKRRIADCENELAAVKQELDAIPLYADYKNEHTIGLLLSYLEKGRADSMKEAINLYEAELLEEKRIQRESSDRMLAEMQRRIDEEAREWDARNERRARDERLNRQLKDIEEQLKKNSSR